MIGSILSAKLLAIGAVVSLAAIAAASAAAGYAGYTRGVAADKQRSDLVIVTLQSEARGRLLTAIQETERKSAALEAAKATSEAQLRKERDANQVLRNNSVAAVEHSDRMRRALTDAATGGVTATADSVAACRERTDAFGRVLGEALRAHAVCTGDLEDAASSYRAVRDAWPVTP